MLRVGFIGWRGMVGSVLMSRMRENNDFAHIEPVFFSTSSPNTPGPDVGHGTAPLQSANNLEALKKLDVIITCQGGDYTSEMYPKLRAAGFAGYWIDAASTLRMSSDALIILDPVNGAAIEAGLRSGIKTFVGGNCTVSLMLMALGGLFAAGEVEWLSSMTYQSASGAGAAAMRELIVQMQRLGRDANEVLLDPARSALDLDRSVSASLHAEDFPTKQFGAPLAANLIPWIDKAVERGQTREEWKGYVETNKILGSQNPIPVDGQCVRVGAMRCHSQAFTIKLKRAIPIDDVAALIQSHNAWVRLVDNTKEATLRHLSPAAVSGTLDIAVGRLRPMRMGDDFVTAFSVGDQLLWGAAEPLRRMLQIILRHA